MKNLHVLSTDKPSRLFYNVGGALLFTNYENYNGVNIYITNDEEIKEGDWYIFPLYKKGFSIKRYNSVEHFSKEPCISLANLKAKKIILTTDQDLIKDGVQAIDDEFLEWFVKNPSCESVGVRFFCCGQYDGKCEPKCFRKSNEIIIPKEEAKQELEKEMFELEQELDIPSNLRWHNSKPKQETIEDIEDLYLMKNVRLWLKTQQDLADKIIFKNK